MSDPVRGLKAVLHDMPPDALLGGPDALVAEPGPDLTIALAVERRVGEDAPDVSEEFLLRSGAQRTAPLGFRPVVDRKHSLMTPGIQRRSGKLPKAAEAGQALALPGGVGGRFAYGFPLLRAKGRSAEHRRRSNSLSIDSMPIYARSRALSSSRSSVGRPFRPDGPPARKSSRQAERMAAVTTGCPRDPTYGKLNPAMLAAIDLEKVLKKVRIFGRPVTSN
jgi:hypothetical protein